MKIKKPSSKTESSTKSPSIAVLSPGAICAATIFRMAGASPRRHTEIHMAGFIGECELGVARVTCPLTFGSEEAARIECDLRPLGLFAQFAAEWDQPVRFFVFAEGARGR